MEMGSLKTDNSIMIAKRRTKIQFLDGMPLSDPSYHADALSMVCMSDVKTPVSYDEDSDMITNGPISSSIPIVFLKQHADASAMQKTGSFLLFSSWQKLEQAFELYSLQGSVMYSKSIHILAKYHRTHVEASPVGYFQHPIGWNPRSVCMRVFFSVYSSLTCFQTFICLTFLWIFFIASASRSTFLVFFSFK